MAGWFSKAVDNFELGAAGLADAADHGLNKLSGGLVPDTDFAAKVYTSQTVAQNPSIDANQLLTLTTEQEQKGDILAPAAMNTAEQIADGAKDIATGGLSFVTKLLIAIAVGIGIVAAVKVAGALKE